MANYELVYILIYQKKEEKEDNLCGEYDYVVSLATIAVKDLISVKKGLQKKQRHSKCINTLSLNARKTLKNKKTL